MADFKKSINKILINEGGYVNDKDDRGGETNFGISKRAYPHVNIKALTKDKASKIYKQDYWDKIKGDDINDNHTAFEIFDTAVNMGPRTSSKLVQTIVKSYPDGIIGDITLKKINDMDKELFISKFRLIKIARYLYIVKKRPRNRKYLYGWIRRVLGE